MGASITLEKITDGQMAKVKEIVEAALRKSGLKGDAVQEIIERGGELKNKLIPVFQELGERSYADEEVESTYGYPEGWKLKSVSEQLVILEKIEEFKVLDGNHVIEIAKGFLELPEGAEGLVVIPKPSKVGKSYNESVELVTKLMAKHRKDWYNFSEGRLGPEHLRLNEKPQQALSQLERETPGDYLVLAVQTGLRHRGRSDRRARVMFSDNEFGLGPYKLGIILLLHPERLQKSEHLAIDCAGCECFSATGRKFPGSFYFDWSAGSLNFGLRLVDSVHPRFGSASGFLE